VSGRLTFAKLALETPVFDDMGKPYTRECSELGGDKKCGVPGGSRLTKTATREWETDLVS
jgi:hypothetical protein